jgi:DNA-binding NarL/FixJ family response regulator
MVPFLKDVLACAGLGEVVAYRCASAGTLRRARPDLVLLDVDARGAQPLGLIRETRRQTSARIVVITRSEDRAWQALALALGADAVLGPWANRQDLFTAVAGAS